MSKRDLFSKLNSFIGKRVKVNADMGEGNVLDIKGKVHKYGKRYVITTDEKSGNRIEIETKRKGSIWTWRGTYLEHNVKTIESGKEVLNLTIADNSTLNVKEDKQKETYGEKLTPLIFSDFPKLEIDFSDNLKSFDSSKIATKK